MIRYSAIISDGTFPCQTAILQGKTSDVLRQAAEAGYDCVQLTIRAPSDYDAAELNRFCAEYGLRISALATGRVYTVDKLSMGSSDEVNRNLCVGRLKELAKFAAQVGRPALVIGSVRGRYADATSVEQYYEQFDRSLREVAGFCEELGVPVILEAIERAESEAYCDPEMTQRYVKRVGSPALSMYLDVMHLYNEGFDPVKTIRRFGRFCPQIDISGEERRAPMDSVLDFAAITTAIRESGFDGVLSFEMPPETSAEKSLAYIRNMMES